MRCLMPILTVTALLAACAPLPAQVPGTRAADPLLDDLKGVAPQSEPAKPGSPASLSKRLEQELTGGEDLGQEPQPPLVRIARRAKLAEDLLRQQDAAQGTQDLQRLIADELAALVKQSNSGQQPNPSSKSTSGKQGKKSQAQGEGTGEARTRQGTDSSQRVEQGNLSTNRQGDPRETLRKLWGHLPEKLREQMLNTPPEVFLPKYQRSIEEYYRRLTEELP